MNPESPVAVHLLPESAPPSADMEADAVGEATPAHLADPDTLPMDSAPMEVTAAADSAPAGEAVQVVAPREPTVAALLADAEQLYEESEIESEGVHLFRIADFPKFRLGEERQYSPEFTIGGHTWRLLIFPKGNRQTEFLSVFIESVDAKKPAEEIGDRWKACVHFALTAQNSEDPAAFVSNLAHHRFTPKESDWGFNQLVRFSELVAVRPEGGGRPIYQNNGFTIGAYVRVIKDTTGVLWWNDLTDYDSKKETGFVGLKNQGATCYMNSLLQSLYFTNIFRKMVYQIPTDKDTPTGSIPLALQRVFYNLQISPNPPDTRELTKSFGWNTLDAFMQHDVQEFNRVLQDNLETKMKGTKAEGAVTRIFGGKTKSYIKCVNVDYESSRVEDFNDIQLVVKGIKTLRESFENYCAVEMMDGDNKYAAEGHGLQDAKKGISFISFPPVLHLQLRRFEYDFQRDMNVKINDRFEFPPEIDLAEFLDESSDKTQNWRYICVGVLVHAGDTHGGHYYALIKPSKDGRWLKFDDDKVTPVADREVYEDNFGGDPLPSKFPGLKPQFKRYVNAYMLVYMRETAMDEVLAEVTEEDVPGHLVERIERERQEQEREKKEREEQHLYMQVKVLTNAVIKKHNQGFDLWNFDEKNPKSPLQTYKVRKDELFGTFKQRLSEDLQMPPEKMRVWTMAGRQNKTVRPDAPLSEVEDDKRMETLKDRYARSLFDFRLYVEESEGEYKLPDGKVAYFLPRDDASTSQSLVIFIKFYDPAARRMEFAFSLTVRNRNSKLSDTVPVIAERLGFQKDTPLRLYEEVKPGMIDLLKLKNTFQQSELGDGDILVAMKDLSEQEMQQMPADTPADPAKYFEWLQTRVVVQFKPRDTEQKPESPLPEFELELTKRTHYDDVARRVAQRIALADHSLLRFWLAPMTNAAPRNLVRRTPTTTVLEMLQPAYNAPVMNMLFYEVSDVPITEMDSKRNLKLTFVDYRNKDAGQHDITVPKTANVEQVLEMLRPKLKLDMENGSGKLRMFYLQGYRMQIQAPTEEPKDSTFGTVYVEEIPKEETMEVDGDKVFSVFHFNRDLVKTHGIPFRILVRRGERVAEVKRRMQERLGMSDKDWAKVKVCFAPPYGARPTLLDDADVLTDRESDSLGLDHPDKSKPANRFGLEKAIKFFG